MQKKLQRKTPMKPKDSPQKVAENIKEYFHANNTSIESVANKFGVPKSEIENLLNGEQYMSIQWGIQLYTAFGINFSYCSMGMPPMLDDKADEFDMLLEAVIEYREAEDSEDNFNSVVNRLNLEELSETEKKLLDQKHLELIQERKETRSYLDYLIDQFDKSDIGRQKYYTHKNRNNKNIIKYKTKMKLHEAIAKVISDAGRPLTYTEIAKAINQDRLYTRGDLEDVPTSQISARVNSRDYESLFEITTINGVQHINNKQS